MNQFAWERNKSHGHVVFLLRLPLGESWGMANDRKRRTKQYLVEWVKASKCFHPRMLTHLMARVNTN